MLSKYRLLKHAMIIAIVLAGCTSKVKENEAISSTPIEDPADSTIINFTNSLPGEDIAAVDSNGQIKQMHKHFIDTTSDDILIAVPYSFPQAPFSKIFLARNVNNKYEIQDWFIKDATEFSVADVDADGIVEIVCEYSSSATGGIFYKIYEIISLKNGRPGILYSKYSEEANEDAEYVSHNPGDTLSLWTTCSLIDLENDGILEVKEIVELVKVDKVFSEDSLSVSTQMDTVIVKLTNIKRVDY